YTIQTLANPAIVRTYGAVRNRPLEPDRVAERADAARRRVDLEAHEALAWGSQFLHRPAEGHVPLADSRRREARVLSDGEQGITTGSHDMGYDLLALASDIELWSGG